MPLLLDLFLSFFKIGAFTIGGGYAMIPLIEREVVKNKKWIEKEEFAEMLALAQTAPGPIAVNTAVFVGYKLDRKFGSIVGCLGAALPSFLIILLIAFFFSQTFQTNEIIQRIFKGIRPVVIALIAAPACNMLVKIGWNYKPLLIVLVSTFLIVVVDISPVIVMLAAGAFGYINSTFIEKQS